MNRKRYISCLTALPLLFSLGASNALEWVDPIPRIQPHVDRFEVMPNKPWDVFIPEVENPKPCGLPSIHTTWLPCTIEVPEPEPIIFPCHSTPFYPDGKIRKVLVDCKHTQAWPDLPMGLKLGTSSGGG